jgi:hypothetical protein
MLNAIYRWTARIGCCLAAVATLGCGSSENGPAVTPTNAPAATQEHGEHDGHEHANNGHGHEGHGHGDHEGHDHSHADAGSPPADFASAVAELQSLYETIRDAFQSGDQDKADNALHQVGHLLEALPELAGEAGLGEQELAQAKSASSAMFEEYGNIDEAIHSGKEPDYEAVAEKLDTAMAELSALAKTPDAAE